MDIFAIISEFGIPITVACAFGFFIWKQNQYIQKDLTADLKRQGDRLESILIKLIDGLKVQQLEMKSISSSYKSLVDIIKKLWNEDKK